MDVKVTAEIRYNAAASRWEATATDYGVVTATADSEEAVKESFVQTWNAARDTTWAPGEFEFVNDPTPPVADPRRVLHG